MIFSLNENRKPTIINEMFFLNEGLVMFDKEMKVFYKTKQLNTRTEILKMNVLTF